MPDDKSEGFLFVMLSRGVRNLLPTLCLLKPLADEVLVEFATSGEEYRGDGDVFVFEEPLGIASLKGEKKRELSYMDLSSYK